VIHRWREQRKPEPRQRSQARDSRKRRCRVQSEGVNNVGLDCLEAQNHPRTHAPNPDICGDPVEVVLGRPTRKKHAEGQDDRAGDHRG